MRIVVKAFNELREYTAGLPPDGALEVPPGATVREVLTRLGIPAERQGDLPLFRNGRPAFLHTPLENGDTLVTFAPMYGG
jgi:sulfur carrier protein ThiS